MNAWLRMMIGAGLLLSSVRLASAAVWYVSPWGSDAASGLTLPEAFQTLQYAVDRSSNGDTIYADAGTYNVGSGSFMYGEVYCPVRVALNKTVGLESIFGAEYTIIEGRAHSETTQCGANSMRGVFIINGAQLRGFTVRNGHTTDALASSDGGGIFAAGDGAYIYDCVIENCSAMMFGGGAYRGGYYRCRFVNNSCLQYGQGAGGGVHDAQLYSCQIVSNIVVGVNGESNQGAHGAGVSWSTLYNCYVEGNRVINGSGGGLYQCTAYNAVIRNNRVTVSNPSDNSEERGYGGGAYGGQLFNCTVVGNSTAKQGGGMAAVSNAFNCILLNNLCPGVDADYFSSTLAYSLSNDPVPPGGAGNITGNPYFVNSTAGDYHLTSISPCRDAGLWMTWMADSWPWDYDKNLRVVGTTVDMGAFEYAANTMWDAGYQDIGGGWRRLSWFGDYIPMGGEGWIWHNKHGFFYVPSDATPTSVWLYAQDLGWLWTSSTTYPFLYRQSDAAWLWYNGAQNPRWFRNMTAGTWESRNP